MIGAARSAGNSLVIVAAGATALIVILSRMMVDRRLRTSPTSYSEYLLESDVLTEDVLLRENLLQASLRCKPAAPVLAHMLLS